jgi:hypothetical protein
MELGMAYRTGTYVAFHAGGSSDPTESDMKYYGTLRMWDVRPDHEFEFVNSHEKTAAVRDSSKKETLRRRLIERLNRSKNMILIIGEDTKDDTDWIPFEIRYAVDECEIPIIATHVHGDFLCIVNPEAFRPLWPQALAARIDNGAARVIHVPFREKPLAAAVGQFNHDNLPNGGLAYYVPDAYRSWGLCSSCTTPVCQ